MIIHIEDLKFQTIIGILDFERVNVQDISIDVEIEYVYDKEFINYADVVALIKETMKEEKFFLIEDALKELSKILKEKFIRIDTLSVKITKPSILPDCKVSVAEFYSFDS